VRHKRLTSTVSFARAMSSVVGVWKAFPSRERSQFIVEESSERFGERQDEIENARRFLSSSSSLHLVMSSTPFAGLGSKVKAAYNKALKSGALIFTETEEE